MTLAWFVQEALDFAGIEHDRWMDLEREEQTGIIRNWEKHVGAKGDYVKAANFVNTTASIAKEMTKWMTILEAALRNGDFGIVDHHLDTINVDSVSPAILLAILSLTFPAKPGLAARAGFLTRAEASLVRQLGRARASALLAERR
jgi:hypothetical protein